MAKTDERNQSSARAGTIGRIITAIASEGMLSVAHALASVVVARFATKSEYATYVLLFSIIGVFNAYQAAVISGPLIVLVNRKTSEAQERYVASLSLTHRYIIASFLPISLLAYAILGRSTKWPLRLGLEIGVVGCAVAAYLHKEYLRTLSYAALDTTAIVRMDLATALAIALGTVPLVATGEVSAVTVLAALSAGYAVASVAAPQRTRPKTSLRSMSRALKENWVFGQWSVLGATASLLQDRGYLYIVSWLLGLGTLAELAAARLLFMPLQLLGQGTIRVMMAKGSLLLASGGRQAFRGFVRKSVVMLLAIWLMYCGVVTLFAAALVHHSLGDKYRDAGELLPLWGLYFGVLTIRRQLTTALSVLAEFKSMAWHDVSGSVAALSACIVLAQLVGRKGAIVALIVGETVTLTQYIWTYSKSRLADWSVDSPSALSPS